MPGLGTIVNCAAIVAGGIIGVLFGRFLPERFQTSCIMTCGLCTIFIGAGGAMAQMLRLSEGGTLSAEGSMMLIGCLILGTLAGELLKIEDNIERFGEWLKQKTGNANDGGFVHAFVTASLTVCVGAMAIVGSIQDGLLADHSVLFAKSTLDFIIIIVMAASMGKGCAFSAIPVGLLQGGVTLLSRFISPLITPAALSNLSFVGSVMIFCVGINLCFGKRFKVGNQLPALIIAVAWALLLG